MLCRNCGKPQSEHFYGCKWCTDKFGEAKESPLDDMTFEPAGKAGHEGIGKWYAEVVQTTQDLPKPKFLTGMSIAAPTSNPKFHAALKTMAEVHDKKSLDYADTANGNFYTNFEEAAREAGVSVEEAFLVLIGVKLARLRELKKKHLAPQNESVQDSRLDLANYCVLMYSYFID